MKPWAEDFYKSKSWLRTRQAYLISQFFLCERCGNPAKVVHHKTRLNIDNITNAEVTLNWNNLEALCQDCHNKEHHKQEKRYYFDENGEIIPR